jgi:aspartyl-tRNA(Asn)/glutamyl-tRNA(Gln) amidotransferase subunit A
LFTFSSIQEYHAQLLAGNCTCIEAVHFYLTRIREQKKLNAYVNVYAEEALARAKALDESRSLGGRLKKMHGVVIGIKDVICYKDHPVTAASHILQQYISPYSATVVERLLAEDAIIIGHLNCDEFAMGSTNENSVYGKVLNPVDESRVPGGSSGGSAAAVRANLCMVSLGTDTGGSVRQPANFCGITGYKPSYGRISRHGVIAYASSFDQVGIFGSALRDIALTAEVISGPDEFDSTVEHQPVPAYSAELNESKQRYRIAYIRQAFEHPSLDENMRRGYWDFINRLKGDGYEVEPIEFDYLDYIVPTYYILTTAEASSNLARYDGIRYGTKVNGAKDLQTHFNETRSSGFGTEVKRRILLGTFVLSSGYYDAYFRKAQAVRKKLIKKTQLIFNEFEAVIMPVSPTPAFESGTKISDPVGMYLADIYTVYANLAGTPAISLPLFETGGLPYGLQIMTNQFCELSLFRFSHHLMQQYKSFDNS